jgi:hypothetical protein
VVVEILEHELKGKIGQSVNFKGKIGQPTKGK